MYYQRTRHLPFTRTGRKYTLIISAVGFETYEKAIEIVPNERNKQTVVLKPSVTELDEVVVTSTGVKPCKKISFQCCSSRYKRAS